MPIAVSVVVPAYNMEAYLEAALRSIARQTMGDFECIVVDDFSTDGTKAIAERYRRNDARFRLVAHRANGGLSAARNSGLRAASGDYVTFLDADDLMTPHSLAMRLETCRVQVSADRRWAGAYCGTKTVQESAKNTPPEAPVLLPDVGFPTSGGMCPFNANQPMIRRDVLFQAGGFDESLKQAEDYDLWMRIMRAGYWFAAVQRVGVAYRAREGSMVRKQPLEHLGLSMGFMEAANQGHAPSAADRANIGLFDVPIPYTEPVDAYAVQVRKSGRVLEFVGMATLGAQSADIDRLAGIVEDHLPDLPLIVPPGKDILDRMLEKGTRRQTGEVSPGGRDELAMLKAAISRWVSRRHDTDQIIVEPTEAERLAGAVYFFPHSAYHAWTIDLIAPALREAGMPFIIVDISTQWGDVGIRQKLSETGLPSISYNRFVLERHRPGLIVALNDWDHVTRPILAAARVAGIPNAAIVEGIQDYGDVDTGRRRQPYQLASAVLLPGAFDRRYFPKGGRQRLYDVGIPRVKHLRAQPSTLPEATKPIALINSNFSYYVLAEHRDEWVRSAVAAVRAAGLDPVISRHPGDAGREHSELVTSEDFYTALSRSTVTVQRFASGILEALALGRGVVYFNPHGEKIDKFSDPLGAYEITTTQTDLVEALTDWRGLLAMAAQYGPAFLDLHAGPAAASIEDSIVTALGAERTVSPADSAVTHFHTLLGHIDVATGALTDGRQMFLEIDDASLAQEFGRLGELASGGDVRAGGRRTGMATFRPIWFLRSSVDSFLLRTYRREKERNSRLYKWAQPLVGLYRKFIAPY